MAEAREAGVHFVAAGHYATETLGIRRLGELVAERFGVQHVFLDVPESGLRRDSGAQSWRDLRTADTHPLRSVQTGYK